MPIEDQWGWGCWYLGKNESLRGGELKDISSMVGKGTMLHSQVYYDYNFYG